MAGVTILDARANSLARAGETLTRLATGAAWGEGPIWLHEDGSVLWSDIPNDRMLRWHPDQGQSVWRERIGFVNGHAREADGSLLHCSHGLRAILRTRFRDGRAFGPDELLVDRYQGRRLNSPNDVIVKRDGTIWFTDPPYGIGLNRSWAPTTSSASSRSREPWTSSAISWKNPTDWRFPPTSRCCTYPI